MQCNAMQSNFDVDLVTFTIDFDFKVMPTMLSLMNVFEFRHVIRFGKNVFGFRPVMRFDIIP